MGNYRYLAQAKEHNLSRSDLSASEEDARTHTPAPEPDETLPFPASDAAKDDLINRLVEIIDRLTTKL